MSLLNSVKPCPAPSTCTSLYPRKRARWSFSGRSPPAALIAPYGVHVAQLAGLPRDVVARAQEVLAQLENGHAATQQTPASAQPALFSVQPAQPSQTQPAPVPSEIEQEILRLSPDQMTPLEALASLYDLRRMAEQSRNGATDDN